VLEQVLQDYLTQENLQNSRIAVACSAGIDSLALLAALISIHPQEQIICLHLDHGLRAESSKAHDYLENFCATHRIQFIGKSYSLGQLSSDENTLRQARYDFFLEVCFANQVKDLFLAHNLNDQAETVLFRLFRGTNSAGLTGIANKRDHQGLTLHRPLLKVSRQEITDYAQEHQLQFIEDSSNSDVNYARNRIRLNILPEALLINPAVLNNLSLVSEIINEEQKYFAELINSELIELGPLPWSLESFRQKPSTIQRKILEQCFTPNIAFVNQFLKAIAEGGFHRINYKNQKFFTIKQKKIFLEQGL